MESLNELKLLAQGGQADIYHYGENKVLRVLRNPQDAGLLVSEIAVMKALLGLMDVPEVFESMAVEGRPAVVVEKISGPSMMDEIKRHPLTLKKHAAKLAELHTKMPEDIDIGGLGLSKGRARYLIGISKLSEEYKTFAMAVLDELAEGTALCHGDFHPGNILISGGKNYLIDWFGAYKGNLISDAAHTYLLLKNVPEAPGISGLQFKMIKASAAMIAKTYLNAFYEIKPFDHTEFSKWLLVKAGERYCYGMDGEKPKLIQFIQKCRANASQPEKWYRYL